MATKFIVILLIGYSLTFSVLGQEDEQHYQGGHHNLEHDHEAFLGKDQAEEYTHLTPKQSQERLEKLIPAIDKDADGQVTEQELKDHVRHMHKRYVENDVARAWDLFKDYIVNDKLPWPGYRARVFGPYEAEGKELTHELKLTEQRDEKRWQAADRSGDGALDKPEYGCFIHPEAEQCDHMSYTVVQETMDLVDKNKDGFVDADEHIAQWYRPAEHDVDGKPPEWVQQEKDAFKELRDKNKDGLLNFEELKDWIMPSNMDRPLAEAKHLIAQADDNKDMALSKAEILSHWQVFVGSQATNFGQQLQKHDPMEL